MKNFVISYGVLLFVSFLLVKCTVKEEKPHKQEIPVAEAFKQLSEIKCSDYFKNICYVALETTEECLIGSQPEITLLKDKILAISSSKECLLFDAGTGKFIRKIGHVGNDPGGYSDPTPWVNEEESLIYFKGWKNDWIVYNEEGNYITKIEVPVDSYETFPSVYFHLAGDTLAGYYRNMFGEQSNKLLYFTKQGEIIQEIPLNEKIPNHSIQQIAVWKNESTVKQFGQAGNRAVVILSGEDPDIESIVLTGTNYFWKNQGGSYFKEEYNDTIYSMTGTSLSPAYIFNLGDYTWPYTERYNKKLDKNIVITYLLDGEDVLLFQLVTHLFNSERRACYWGVYEKKNQTVRVNPVEKGIKNDIHQFLPLQPSAVTSSGTFAALLPAETIGEWIEEQDDKEIAAPLQNLKQLKEDDNPVVVFFN